MIRRTVPSKCCSDPSPILYPQADCTSVGDNDLELNVFDRQTEAAGMGLHTDAKHRFTSYQFGSASAMFKESGRRRTSLFGDSANDIFTRSARIDCNDKEEYPFEIVRHIRNVMAHGGSEEKKGLSEFQGGKRSNEEAWMCRRSFPDTVKTISMPMIEIRTVLETITYYQGSP